MDAGRLRHWDGRSWGTAVRSAPAWSALARDVHTRVLAPRPQVRWRAARWLAGASLALFLAALAAFSSVTSLTSLPPGEKIDDPQFRSAARAACVAAAEEVAALPSPRLTASGRVTARYIDTLATRYERLVEELRAIPVDLDDDPAVRRWLDAFARYADNGHDYADELRRTGPGARAEMVRQRVQQDLRLMASFERTNGLQACPP